MGVFQILNGNLFLDQKPVDVPHERLVPTTTLKPGPGGAKVVYYRGTEGRDPQGLDPDASSVALKRTEFRSQVWWEFVQEERQPACS